MHRPFAFLALVIASLSATGCGADTADDQSDGTLESMASSRAPAPTPFHAPDVTKTTWFSFLPSEIRELNPYVNMGANIEVTVIGHGGGTMKTYIPIEVRAMKDGSLWVGTSFSQNWVTATGGFHYSESDAYRSWGFSGHFTDDGWLEITGGGRIGRAPGAESWTWPSGAVVRIRSSELYTGSP